MNMEDRILFSRVNLLWSTRKQPLIYAFRVTLHAEQSSRGFQHYNVLRKQQNLRNRLKNNKNSMQHTCYEWKFPASEHLAARSPFFHPSVPLPYPLSTFLLLPIRSSPRSTLAMSWLSNMVVKSRGYEECDVVHIELFIAKMIPQILILSVSLTLDRKAAGEAAITLLRAILESKAESGNLAFYAIIRKRTTNGYGSFTAN